MKKILYIITIGFVVCFISSSFSVSQPEHNDDSDYRLINLVPDSIINLLEDRPFLLYHFGHNGHKWSIIVKSDSSFTTYSGERTYGGEQSVMGQTVDTQFDTTAFFKTYKNLINWGIDSLSDIAKSMTHNKRSEYFAIYRSLRAYTKGLNIDFDSDDDISFSGRDSTIFNRNLSELELLMWWLASPEIRPYLTNIVKF